MNPTDGWRESAPAWLTEIGSEGDYARQYILDAPMLQRIEGRNFQTALDLGCGEGRFCRMMQQRGLKTIGIDPTAAFIERARELDPQGDYRIEGAEGLSVPAQSCDLVVSYLSLIDIPDLPLAVEKLVRTLRPGGVFLLANLTSFNTAAAPDGWILDQHGQRRFAMDRYLEERSVWVEWSGIRVQNWHRPLSTYMQLFLGHGLQLQHFAEPTPTGDNGHRNDRYCRAPWFHIMEWKKPA
ncbi:class I SAM-dependent methyltransferase [Bryobacter aggregatus]|uniref:class I SAM-dependent methyltransferase n=1 Tax=Bryobacter aggregatus TaxID=360054 RepID=UPI0004E10878|nr:class I SAM-dependent methyltransferase [Bryobacter aggregatus]